jgi:hypothetical protein
MRQRSQIPEANEKTTINALIKGLTPGPTASHVTRKKPKTVEELFHELEEYFLSDDDHRKRVAERNEARQGNREMTWRAQSQNPRNINNVENPQPDQNNRPSARGGFAPRGSVTEPPKIIPYYRLSRSTWPLSNNKELLSRFRRVKPGKSHTTGSLICAKPTRRRDQSTTLHYMKGSQVQEYYKPDFSYIK